MVYILLILVDVNYFITFYLSVQNISIVIEMLVVCKKKSITVATELSSPAPTL
jgi:hypothetical protein